MSGTRVHNFSSGIQLQFCNFHFSGTRPSLANLVYFVIKGTAGHQIKPPTFELPKTRNPILNISFCFPLPQWVSKVDTLAKATCCPDLSNNFPVCPQEIILGVPVLNWDVTIFLSSSSLLDEYLISSTVMSYQIPDYSTFTSASRTAKGRQEKYEKRSYKTLPLF
jgi:hypothetical protein